jgi:hypothetical protein
MKNYKCKELPYFIHNKNTEYTALCRRISDSFDTIIYGNSYGYTGFYEKKIDPDKDITLPSLFLFAN